MENFNYLYWILVGSFTLYVVLVSLLFGLQPSLSATYKVLGESWRKPFWFLAFTFWGLLSVILSQNGLMMFGAFGFILVGAAPKFWEKEEGKPHFVGAAMAAIFSQAFLFFCVGGGEWITLGWLLGVLGVALLVGKRTRLLWLEMLCFYSFFLGLYFAIGNV